MENQTNKYTVTIHTYNNNHIIEVGKDFYSTKKEAIKEARYAAIHGTLSFDENFLKDNKGIVIVHNELTSDSVFEIKTKQ